MKNITFNKILKADQGFDLLFLNFNYNFKKNLTRI